MRHRIGFACALAGGIGLALLLVLACHPGFTPSAAAGMSAPLDPATSIASAQTPQLLRLRLDWNGLALQTLGLKLAFEATGAKAVACGMRERLHYITVHFINVLPQVSPK